MLPLSSKALLVTFLMAAVAAFPTVAMDAPTSIAAHAVANIPANPALLGAPAYMLARGLHVATPTRAGAKLTHVAAAGANSSTTTETASYDPTHEVCGAQFTCETFAVPAGSVNVAIAIHDAASPHVGAYYCLNNCSGKTAYFCDAVTLALNVSITTVVVDVYALGGASDLSPCVSSGEAGLPTTGNITAIFSTSSGCANYAPADPLALPYTCGPVLLRPHTYLVFWNFQGNDPSNEAPLVTSFFQHLGGSNYAAIPNEYTNASGTPIAVSSDELAGVWYDNADPIIPSEGEGLHGSNGQPSSVNLEEGIAHEALVASAHFQYDPEGLIIIEMPHLMNDPGLGDAYYCGYHDATVDGQGRPVFFADIGYSTDAPANGCGENFVNPGPAGTLDGVTIVAGHEWAEAVTDPIPFSGWQGGTNGSEIGDKCAWNAGPGDHARDVELGGGVFAVQSLWSNAHDKCILGNPSDENATLPAAFSQQASYDVTSAPCGAQFGCQGFVVPGGARNATVSLRDDYDPHVAGYYCIDSCSGTTGFFCDSTELALPNGTQTLIVDVYALGGADAPIGCVAQPVGLGVQGTISVNFST
ncbi:MAG: hypothetical protein ACYDDF_08435 [Thermoplasmatota archaeon]